MSNTEKIRQEIERRKKICEGIFERESDTYYQGKAVAYGELLPFIDSLPEEKPSEDFPTSDEEVAKFLATHPKVEVPEKYKTPNWLFDKQPSEDLEEAAKEYADKHGFRVPYDGSNNYYDDVDVKASKEGFLARAEWQKDQMMDEWLKDRDGCFRDGVNEGKKAMEEQMTKDAVDGEIGYWNQRGLSIRLDKSLEKLGYGEDTEVKVIIVKQDDRPRD